MPTIKNIQQKYFSKISPSDLEILISYVIKKPKEFILTHPKFSVNSDRGTVINKLICRRLKKEPLAYITGHKEFYGLDFKVNKNVLIPRPETEQIVELAMKNLSSAIQRNEKIIIADIGTGSGNIIISMAKWLKKSKLPITNYQLLASDISSKVLLLARKNAKIHKVDKKIKFLQGDLLEPLTKTIKKEKLKIQNSKFKIQITANLPYLSKKIYASTPADVKKYEPKNALYSSEKGLGHYKNLFGQINFLITNYRLPITLFLEFSPEQKNRLAKLIENYFPQSKIKFSRDLSGKWRTCEIGITPKN